MTRTVTINPIISDGEAVLVRLMDIPDDWAVREYDTYDKWVSAYDIREDYHPLSIFEAKPFDGSVWEWSDATTEPSPTA
jgi:hypothetical protein